MEKTVSYAELLQMQPVLSELAQKKTPFSITTAKVIKQVENATKEFAEKRNEVIDKYAVKDDEGNFIGKEVKDEKTGEMKRIENPNTLVDIQLQEGYTLNQVLEEIDKLSKEKIKLDIKSVDAEAKYWDREAKKQLTIKEFIEQEFTVEMIFALDSLGIVTNLL